jgi:hypothetical protein
LSWFLTLHVFWENVGKTTLLVSIICRYVAQAMERGEECRLLVSAPTNQAISVLATRFMATMKPNSFCKTILVGDAEKLLATERNNAGSHSGSGGGDSRDKEQLRSIFLYQWIPTIIHGYERIRDFFVRPSHGSGTGHMIHELHQLATNLQRRLTSSLPHLSSDVLKWTNQISIALESDGATGMMAEQRDSIVTTTRLLLDFLKEMPSDAVWTQVRNSRCRMTRDSCNICSEPHSSSNVTASLIGQCNFLYSGECGRRCHAKNISH